MWHDFKAREHSSLVMTTVDQREERGISFCAPAGEVTSALPVFYNPVMTHNRDITVLVLKALLAEGRLAPPLRLALPMEATGIRGIRLWKELGQGGIASLALNDVSPEAAELMARNLADNSISDARVTVGCEDASLFLLRGRKQHYIDIDPFGFPGPFLDAACKRIAPGGILAVTATDCGAVCGSYPAAGQRKYWALPRRNMAMHETGLRILARRVQLVAGQYARAAHPIFSYAKDHYMRIFFSIEAGRTAADRIVEQHGWLSLCRKCLRWEVAGLPFQKACACGAPTTHLGPLFLGPLWDAPLVERVRETNPHQDLEKFLTVLAEESRIPAVGFYDLHEMVKAHGLKHIPRREEVIARLAEQGFEATGTHFTGKGVRTRAGFDEVLSVLRELSAQQPQQ